MDLILPGSLAENTCLPSNVRQNPKDSPNCYNHLILIILHWLNTWQKNIWFFATILKKEVFMYGTF